MKHIIILILLVLASQKLNNKNSWTESNEIFSDFITSSNLAIENAQADINHTSAQLYIEESLKSEYIKLVTSQPFSQTCKEIGINDKKKNDCIMKLFSKKIKYLGVERNGQGSILVIYYQESAISKYVLRMKFERIAPMAL